jgi:hypothetical protein
MHRTGMRRTTSWSRKARKSRRNREARWTLPVGALGTLLMLAAATLAVYGAGQHGAVFAAGQPNRQKHESEAKLGARHGEQRANDCTLIVPAHPLSAQGLATPYQLTASSPANTNCHEADTAHAAFVQAAVFDPATSQISIYNPLVIDKGTRPAVAPVVPTLPANAVVGIWFGSNATGLRLRGAQAGTLFEGRCVNGLGGSIFGQVAYCNAPAFFRAANQAIQAGKLTPPPLGTGSDGQTCPTVRDFSVVDQDQSDNVTSTYLITSTGAIAQNTAANAASFSGSTVLANGSDNRLAAVALDTALSCAPWKAPDLADPGQMVTAQPLDELQAAMYQQAPIALVPQMDPMVLVNGKPSLEKQNLYRMGVDQPRETSRTQAAADEKAYCQTLLQIAPARIQQDETFTSARPSPDPAVASNLFTFLAARFSTTFGPDGLNCTGTLNVANPVTLTQSNGVVVGATFAAPAPAQATAPAQAAPASTNP